MTRKAARLALWTLLVLTMGLATACLALSRGSPAVTASAPEQVIAHVVVKNENWATAKVYYAEGEDGTAAFHLGDVEPGQTRTFQLRVHAGAQYTFGVRTDLRSEFSQSVFLSPGDTLALTVANYLPGSYVMVNRA